MNMIENHMEQVALSATTIKELPWVSAAYQLFAFSDIQPVFHPPKYSTMLCSIRMTSQP